MAEEPFDAERPHDESWWESELHRNEKLMDKYMAVLGDNPDWDKWKDPDDLYNKVHFNIDPPERTAAEEAKDPEDVAADAAAQAEDEEFMREINETSESELDEDPEDPDEDPATNEDYPVIADQARKFACNVFDLEKPPGNAELLFLSAGKVGA